MSRSRLILIAAVTLLLFPIRTYAVSPISLEQGKELFEREWQSRNPLLGNDGLGPLFNANSCVACHNQGGTGGVVDPDSTLMRSASSGSEFVGKLINRAWLPMTVENDG